MTTTRRVFVINTDCEQPGDGAWFWVVLDADGKPEGEPVGPFESASEAENAADETKDDVAELRERVHGLERDLIQKGASS